MTVTSALRKLRQMGFEFRASLGYILRDLISPKILAIGGLYMPKTCGWTSWVAGLRMEGNQHVIRRLEDSALFLSSGPQAKKITSS